MKPESHNKKSLIERLLFKFAPNLMLHRKVENLPLKINWRRIFILPTKPGLFFGVVSFLMLVASLNFNNNMGLMMTFLLVGLAQVAMYRVFFNMKNLSIHRATAKPVFLGKKAEFCLFLQASESKYDITVSNDLTQKTLLELPVDEAVSISCEQVTKQRGWLLIEKVKILSSYPFGLFYAWIWTKVDARCLVYPMPEQKPPPLPMDMQNEGNANVVIHGEDFHGVKPYQSGDSMRLIAWKRTAQTGELISREFQQTQGEKLLLDYSQVPLKDMELKLSRLTAWVLVAYQKHTDYCLKLPGYDSGYGYSSKHHLACLKALALFGKGQ